MSEPDCAATALIAIDWGTTNRRAHRLGRDGEILDSRADGLGILNVGAGGFKDAFDAMVGDWRPGGGGDVPPVLMSGMVGSRQGWIEAPYAHCPAALADLAAGILALPNAPGTWVVPGVCLNPEGSRRDVMRGEEVQVFGALALAGRDTATLCLPGTHSKWVKAEGGRLTDFATAMTGEVFQAMREHSILGALMNRHADHDADAFVSGVTASGREGGLLNHLFSVRADGLFGALEEDRQASYLSGLLIGHEIRGLAGMPADHAAPVLVIGTRDLAGIYAMALAHMGIPHQAVDGREATVSGLNTVWAARPAAIGKGNDE